jgi:hypothetical protein
MVVDIGRHEFHVALHTSIGSFVRRYAPSHGTRSTVQKSDDPLDLGERYEKSPSRLR